MKEIYAPNKLIKKRVRNSFMYKGFNFILDTLVIDGLTFSILVIQGYHDSSKIEIPLIIKNNIVNEISCNFKRRKNRIVY